MFAHQARLRNLSVKVVMAETGEGREKRLSVAVELVTEDGGRRTRARRSSDSDCHPQVPPELQVEDGLRPTEVERCAALAVVDLMRKASVDPPILTKQAVVEPKVVACALAIYFKQVFGSDRVAKELFDVSLSTDIRNRWVKGKLALLLEHIPDALSSLHRARLRP